MKITKVISLLIMLLFISACIKQAEPRKKNENGADGGQEPDKSVYIYPFNNEVHNVKAVIFIKLAVPEIPDVIKAEIPYLKYNKSWLCLMTQDDCMHAAYCRTWAAINGKPVSSSDPYIITPTTTPELYYDAAHLQAGDLPPSVIPASKSLSCTDGTGNEVRFAITTTLHPEKPWMSAKVEVKPGFTNNYYRFYRKSGLVWSNVIEMVNYGTGIAFHDVEADDVYKPVGNSRALCYCSGLDCQAIVGSGV